MPMPIGALAPSGMRFACSSSFSAEHRPRTIGIKKIAMNENLPSCNLAVDARLPFQDMQAHIINVCKTLIYEWKDLDNSKFTVYRINGGITNIMASVSVKDDKDASVVVRVFGPATEGILDRGREIQAISYLSLAGFCPKLRGVFKNGIIQSFLAGRTLGLEDLCDNSTTSRVAKELRRLHEQEVPGRKEPMLWTDIGRFFELASAVSFDKTEDKTRLEAISFDELQQEVKKLKEISTLLEAPIVYCHNDLLPANVMIDKEGKYYLIDFEYSGYNYRGFDIGNHFNEYTGFDCDFSAYPDKAKQLTFLKHYLYPDNPDKATIEELEALYVETNFYALTAHLQWAIWTIVQATSGAIDFDYFAYFFRRLNLYKKQKAEFLPLVKAFLAQGKGMGL